MKTHNETFLCPCCNVLHAFTVGTMFVNETNGVVCCGYVDTEANMVTFGDAVTHVGRNRVIELPDLPGATE